MQVDQGIRKLCQVKIYVQKQKMSHRRTRTGRHAAREITNMCRLLRVPGKG